MTTTPPATSETGAFAVGRTSLGLAARFVTAVHGLAFPLSA